MGSIEVKKVLSKGKESSLDNLDIENGKLRFTTDTGRLFLDDDGKRIEITDFVKGLTKDEILSIEDPLPKFYFAIDTYELYYYLRRRWIPINGGGGGSSITIDKSRLIISSSSSININGSKLIIS